MSRLSVRSSLACLALLLSAASLHADTVTMTLNDLNPGAQIGIVFNGTPVSGGAGQLNWTYNSGSNVLGTGAIKTFCIEIPEDVFFHGTYTYNLVDLAVAPKNGALVDFGTGLGNGMGLDRANAIRELWGRFFPTLGTNNDLAASFQFAIWEIVYDFGTIASNQDNLSTGIFQSSDPHAAQASTWLNTLTGDTSRFANLAALSMGDPAIQDQIAELVPTPETHTAVPLPATSLAGSVLLSGLALRRRRA